MNRTFIWDQGNVVECPAPAGQSATGAYLNKAGAVIGYADTTPVFWWNGSHDMQEFSTMTQTPLTVTHFYGINTAGDIVASGDDGNGHTWFHLRREPNSADTIPPLVTNLSVGPVQNGFVTSATPSVAATVNDGGFGVNWTLLSFTIDEVDLDWSRDGSDIHGVPFTAISEGPHTATVYVQDHAGNITVTDCIFRVDSLPPAISEESPSSWVQGAPVIQALVLDEGSGVDWASAVFEVDGEPVDFDYDALAGVIWFMPLENLADGEHTATLEISDHFPRISSTEWTFTSDATPPPISNFRLNDFDDYGLQVGLRSIEATTDSPFPHFGFDWTDTGSGLDFYTLCIDIDGFPAVFEGNAFWLNFRWDSATAPHFAFHFVPMPDDYIFWYLWPGLHSIRIRGSDLVGNTSDETFEFEITETVNPPRISDLTPTGWTSAQPTISAVITGATDGIDLQNSYLYLDNESLWYHWDGEQIYFTPETALSEGFHSVQFYGIDMHGRPVKDMDDNFLVSWNFTVDTVPPVISNFVPNGLINVASPLISATIIDDVSGVNWASVEVWVDGELADVVCIPELNQIEATVPVLSQGEHLIWIYVEDYAGRVPNDEYGNLISALIDIDTIPPQVFSESITVEATGPGGAIVNSFPVIPFDASSVQYNHEPGLFSVGAHSIIWTALDEATNEATGAFVITVRDTTPPALWIRDIYREATHTEQGPGIIVDGNTFPVGTFDPIDTADVVTLHPSVTFSKAVGSFLPIGITHVTVTARDAANNTTSGTINVVVRDTQAPTITVHVNDEPVGNGWTYETDAPEGVNSITVDYVATLSDDAYLPVEIYLQNLHPSHNFHVNKSTIVSLFARDPQGNRSEFHFFVKVVAPPQSSPFEVEEGDPILGVRDLGDHDYCALTDSGMESWLPFWGATGGPSYTALFIIPDANPGSPESGMIEIVGGGGDMTDWTWELTGNSEGAGIYDVSQIVTLQEYGSHTIFGYDDGILKQWIDIIWWPFYADLDGGADANANGAEIAEQTPPGLILIGTDGITPAPLAPIHFEFKSPEPGNSFIRFDIPECFRLWKDEQKEEELKSGSYDAFGFGNPITLFVEPISAGTYNAEIVAVLVWERWNPVDDFGNFGSTIRTHDSVNLTVVNPQINIFKWDPAFKRDPGLLLKANDNFNEALETDEAPDADNADSDLDDANGDHVDDPDVIRLELGAIFGNVLGNGEQVYLEQSGTGRVRVFACDPFSEYTQVLMPQQTSSLITPWVNNSNQNRAASFWLEGVIPGAVTLSLTYYKQGLQCSDWIKIQVYRVTLEQQALDGDGIPQSTWEAGFDNPCQTRPFVDIVYPNDSSTVQANQDYDGFGYIEVAGLVSDLVAKINQVPPTLEVNGQSASLTPIFPGLYLFSTQVSVGDAGIIRATATSAIGVQGVREVIITPKYASSAEPDPENPPPPGGVNPSLAKKWYEFSNLQHTGAHLHSFHVKETEFDGGATHEYDCIFAANVDEDGQDIPVFMSDDTKLRIKLLTAPQPSLTRIEYIVAQITEWDGEHGYNYVLELVETSPSSGVFWSPVAELEFGAAAVLSEAVIDELNCKVTRPYYLSHQLTLTETGVSTWYFLNDTTSVQIYRNGETDAPAWIAVIDDLDLDLWNAPVLLYVTNEEDTGYGSGTVVVPADSGLVAGEDGEFTLQATTIDYPDNLPKQRAKRIVLELGADYPIQSFDVKTDLGFTHRIDFTLEGGKLVSGPLAVDGHARGAQKLSGWPTTIDPVGEAPNPNALAEPEQAIDDDPDYVEIILVPDGFEDKAKTVWIKRIQDYVTVDACWLRDGEKLRTIAAGRNVVLRIPDQPKSGLMGGGVAAGLSDRRIVIVDRIVNRYLGVLAESWDDTQHKFSDAIDVRDFLDPEDKAELNKLPFEANWSWKLPSNVIQWILATRGFLEGVADEAISMLNPLAIVETIVSLASLDWSSINVEAVLIEALFGEIKEAIAAAGREDWYKWGYHGGRCITFYASIPFGAKFVHGATQKGLEVAAKAATKLKKVAGSSKTLKAASVKIAGILPYSKRVEKALLRYGEVVNGRRTGIEVELTKEILETRIGREANRNIRPPGFLGGEARHARAHLYGTQMGGDGYVVSNLITMTQPQNMAMLRIENRVKRFVKTSEKSVLYKVTPKYNPGRNIAHEVHIEAWVDGVNIIKEKILTGVP